MIPISGTARRFKIDLVMLGKKLSVSMLQLYVVALLFVSIPSIISAASVTINTPSNNAAVGYGQGVTLSGILSESNYKSLSVAIDGQHYKDICNVSDAYTNNVARTGFGPSFPGSIALQVRFMLSALVFHSHELEALTN